MASAAGAFFVDTLTIQDMNRLMGQPCSGVDIATPTSGCQLRRAPAVLCHLGDGVEDFPLERLASLDGERRAKVSTSA